MLRLVAVKKRLSEVEDPDSFKNHLREDRKRQWLENRSMVES